MDQTRNEGGLESATVIKPSLRTREVRENGTLCAFKEQARKEVFKVLNLSTCESKEDLCAISPLSH